MPTTTFMCDRYEYPIEHLVKFTQNTDTRVIVRGYCQISRGLITYFTPEGKYANRRHNQRSR